MRDLFPNDWKPRLSRVLLDLDARIDSAVFQAGAWLREYYERYAAFMDRFHVSGWKRPFVELFSDGLTAGAAGSVLMLALAIPAFYETHRENWLRQADLAVTFLDRYGNEAGTRGIRHNDSIPLDQFPDHLIKAALATEDRHFYQHFGIDFVGTTRAFLTNYRAGTVVQGGSSITQQLAKNLFLSNARTLERKVKEAFLAVWLEMRLTKSEILKLYLDRAYLGAGNFGVDAAAQFYFNKSARDVNLAEAAMLAGLFKAPSKFAPHINLPAARGRANVVLDNLVEAGFMTQGQVFGARRNPATVVDRRHEHTPDYYLDAAFEEMQALVAKLPKSVTERVFVVRTALDPALQRQAETAVRDALRQYGERYNAGQAAAVVVDLDGGVRTIVGGRDYGESQFNRATTSLRQPGSSFKPYVYAAALEHGFKPTSVVVDAPICLGRWCPHNYSGGYRGRMSLAQALQYSINTVAVRLSVQIGNGNAKAGRAKIIDIAKRMGVRTRLPDTPSLPIGADAVTVLEHTAAYATLPNDGRQVTPHTLLEVRTAAGELVWRFDRDGEKPKQALAPEVARHMNAMMHNVVEAGTARRARLDGIPASGKTGTTNAYRDAWFVGFTGNFACGIWFGNDDYQPMNRMTGGSIPAQTWQQIMTYAHQGIEIKPIPGVPDVPDRPQHIADAVAEGAVAPPRPPTLTRAGANALVRIERLLDEAARALAVSDRAAPAPRADRGPASPQRETVAAGPVRVHSRVNSD